MRLLTNQVPEQTRGARLGRAFTRFSRFVVLLIVLAGEKGLSKSQAGRVGRREQAEVSDSHKALGWNVLKEAP